MPDEENKLILPLQAGMRDAYVYILREMFIEGHDTFWFSDLINIVSAGCGVGEDTAMSRCKMLARHGLIKYVTSSIHGHKYQVRAYIKEGVGARQIDNWDEFDRTLRERIPEAVETDLMLIRRKGIQRPLGDQGQATTIDDFSGDSPSARESSAIREAKQVSGQYDRARIIRPGEDTVKSEFKALDRMTNKELADQLVAERMEGQCPESCKAENEGG